MTINLESESVLRQQSFIRVAVLHVVVAGVNRLGPVLARTQVLFELAAVQVVQHVQLDLFQVELQRGAGGAQEAPVEPGILLIHAGSGEAGPAALHVVTVWRTSEIGLRLCRV